MLPEGWGPAHVNELYDQLPIGKRFEKKATLSSGLIPVVDQSTDGIIGWHNEEPGIEATTDTPVVTFANHTCEMRVMRRPFSVIQNVFPLVGRPGVCDTMFLYYATKGRVWLEEYKGHFPDYRRKWVPVPPLPEQRAIVSILAALDDKIELNNRLVATVGAMARSLFRSWFVDFDPTRAKQEGQPPFLGSAIWSLFPDHFDEEGKPEGWERIVLRDAADVFSGGTPAKGNADLWNGLIPWISPKVMTDIHVSDSEDRVTQRAIGTGTRMAPAGSVLLMVRGMGLHQGVRISQARRDVTFNQDVKALVPKRLSGSHLLFGMLDAAPYLFSRVEAAGHGTGKLPTEIIDGVSFVTPAPTGAAYARLIPILDFFNDRIAASNAESMTLRAIRDTLLPKLVSGELRVTEPQRILEKSA